MQGKDGVESGVRAKRGTAISRGDSLAWFRCLGILTLWAINREGRECDTGGFILSILWSRVGNWI